MAPVWFRNCDGAPLDRALGRLLEDCLQGGRRVVIFLETEERLRAVDAGLWTFTPDSFVPHGSAGDGFADRQPVWLTIGDDVPNGATVAVVVEDAQPETAFERDGIMEWHYVFDARDPHARERGRERWRLLVDAGRKPTYLTWTRDGWREHG